MTDRLDAAAALDFALVLRRRWTDQLYPHVRAEHEARCGTADLRTPPAAPAAADHAAAAVPAVRSLPTYPWFAWLERGAQKMLWRAVGDVVDAEAPAQAGAIAPATLMLDPALQLPDWYVDWDIHLQPHGVWSSDRAAHVYELGARLVMLGDNDDYKFHRLFAATALPAGQPRRIVDLGCGFGKSTWPLKQRYPDAEVIGIDLAAPCLRLAAQRAGDKGLAIHFRQASATATGLDAASVDLVTATMLIHELPLAELRQLFVEARRILAPGGELRILDFHLTGDAFRDLAMLEHGARNNEPFMTPMLATDVAALARDAGLVDVRWVAFDEREAGRLEALRWPARAEWHFPWAVLEARAPA